MRFLPLLILLPLFLSSQGFKRTLYRSNSLQFHNTLYVFGFEQNKMDLHLKIYKLALNLGKADSLIVNLGKDRADNYLEINADSLHDHINIYLQKENSKNKASLIRLDDSLRIVARADNFEVTKINGLTSFEDEKYVLNKQVYLVRTTNDSLGKQFYLDKFEVSDIKKPFEYVNKWQFPFEKRHIKTAHVFYADTQIVMIYVHVLTGEKTGQWVLRLNSNTGELIKGSRLNPKGDKRHFLFSGFHYDKKLKQLLVAGNVYTNQQLNFETPAFTFANFTKQNPFFFTLIDSLGEVIQREEKIVPITIPAKAGSKQLSFYHVKIREIRKKSESDYSMYCDIYKSTGQELIFLYETGIFVDLALSDMVAEAKTSKIYQNQAALPNFLTTDPKDINGKFELKSISEFDKLLYATPLADVEKFYGKDDLSNPKWVLTKTDIKNGNTTFYSIKVGQKGIEQKIILENSKYNHPSIYKVNNEKLLLFNTDQTGSAVEINLINW